MRRSRKSSPAPDKHNGQARPDAITMTPLATPVAPTSSSPSPPSPAVEPGTVGDFASGWVPLSSGPGALDDTFSGAHDGGFAGADAYAGASMVDAATSAAQAFGNGAPGPPYRGVPSRGVAAGRGIIDEFEDDSDKAEEPAVEDPGWSRFLRGVGRVGAWALPLAAVGLGVSALWGWPQPGVNSDRPGTWLILTIEALGLGLLGVLAVGALLAATPGRRWAVLGGAATLAGTTLLAPVLGVVALARPAVTNASAQLGDEALALQANLIDGRVARWLLVGGLALLVVGVSATGVAVVASGVLAPFDGYLLIGGVAVAVFAAWASLQFVLVIAAMVLLAGALGLAWTASRITPDGRGPDLD